MGRGRGVGVEGRARARDLPFVAEISAVSENYAEISIEKEMKKSYLDYAMSVIIGRALPDVRDGLKPVHRRVLYAMRELKNDWNKPLKPGPLELGFNYYFGMPRSTADHRSSMSRTMESSTTIPPIPSCWANHR